MLSFQLRNAALDLLLEKEREESKAEVVDIDKKWPIADGKGWVRYMYRARGGKGIN